MFSRLINMGHLMMTLANISSSFTIHTCVCVCVCVRVCVRVCRARASFSYVFSIIGPLHLFRLVLGLLNGHSFYILSSDLR
jgi:predicted metal-binding protein